MTRVSSYRALVTNAADGTVSAFTIADDSLVRTAVSPVGTGCSTLAIDRQRGLVHVGVKGDQLGVQTCALDEGGRLSPVANLPTTSSLTYLTLTPDCSKLLGVSYGGGYGLVWSVGDDGRLGEVTARIEYPNLHSVIVDSSGRFAYFVSLGADLVAGYALGQDGGLSPLPPAAAPEGSGPRHIVLNANEDVAYVITEFSGQVLAYRRELGTGELTLTGTTDAYDPSRGLQHSVFGADPREHHYIWGADLHLGADDRYLFCSERCESTLAALPVAPDGSLTPASTFVVTEEQPRGFGLTPDGAYLLATGERSTRVSLYRVGAQDGSLTLVDRVETGGGANWVRFY